MREIIQLTTRQVTGDAGGMRGGGGAQGVQGGPLSCRLLEIAALDELA